jgi:hypothetical protein
MGRQNTFSLKPKNGRIVPVSVLYKRGTEQPETTLTGQYPGAARKTGKLHLVHPSLERGITFSTSCDGSLVGQKIALPSEPIANLEK